MVTIFGIESSCDETAVAILHIDSQGRAQILAHKIASQLKIHAAYGGVVPEIASQEHLKAIEDLALSALEESGLKKSDITAIACVTAPGLIGALMVGAMFGQALAFALVIPFIPIHHLEAHLLIGFVDKPANLIQDFFPFLGVLISGGHCQIIEAFELGKYKIIGKTLDDSIGEAFDKLAVMLGLPYPGGPNIELMAKNGNITAFKLPMPLCNTDNPDFSLSGLKTHLKLLIAKQTSISVQWKSDLCASFQFTISKILVKKMKFALSILHAAPKYLVIAGGVASNQYIKGELKKAFESYNLIIPEPNFCTDNAIMVAYLGALKFLTKTATTKFAIQGRWSLEDIEARDP